MKITHHGAYLTQLTRYGAVFPVNCYLVCEEGALTLIDAGLPGGAPATLAEAKRIGLPITRIVLTHAHYDHTGSLDALHAALPQAEIAISARDARYLAGDRSLDAGEAQTPIKGSPAKCATRPTHLLADGELVGSLRVVTSPGHTPGHIALYDTRDGSLIAGDALQTRGGIAVAGVVRPLFPFPAMGTWHLPTALQSAQRLRELQPTRLAVGHGRVLEAPLAAMERAIAVAQRKVGHLPSEAKRA
jgi:glyoxylase-like metal-dependent hydrolase (beta-lactamase superfamily II)